MKTAARWILSAILLAFVSSSVAQAKTITLSDDNISIDIPDAWNSTPRPGTLFSAGDATNTSVVSIVAFPNTENHGLESSYTDGIKNDLLAQAQRLGGTGQIVKETALTLGTAPAYLIEARFDLPQSQTAYMFRYLVAANHKVYVVAFQNYDASRNDQMETIAQSFHFATPPELPDTPGNATPRVIPVPGADFSVTLPPGWTSVAMEGNLFFAKDETFISTVSIKSYPYQASPQAFIQALKKVTPQGLLFGATIEYKTEGPATIDQVPAYFLQGTGSMGKSEKDYLCDYALAANNQLYLVSLQTGDPAKAPIVEAIAHSLKFDHPPQLSPPPVSDYERGFKRGHTLFYVLLAGLIVLGIGRFIFFRR